MSARALRIGWVVASVAFAALLGYELTHWRALVTERRAVAAEQHRLTDEIRHRDGELAAALGAPAKWLGGMVWKSTGTDPSAALARLAELAAEKQMKVLAVGPLERQVTPEFAKSWYAVQVLAPFRTIRELAARVERDGGLLEDVRLELVPARPGAAIADEVWARFRMTAVEPSENARKVLVRTLSTRVASVPAAAASLEARPSTGPVDRDPFVLLSRSSPAAGSGGDDGALPSSSALALSAIASFPGGSWAVVNDQIVKVGDLVGGHRVETITDTSVSVRGPGARAHTITLPEQGPVGPSPLLR